MFGISWPELLVVLVVAAVVIGPKDLPRVLYTAGKMMRKARAYMQDIQKSVDEITRDVELEDIAREANRPGGEDLQMEIERQIQIEQNRKSGQVFDKKAGADD